MHRFAVLLCGLLLAVAPATLARAQSAGDNQYEDPCANGACAEKAGSSGRGAADGGSGDDGGGLPTAGIAVGLVAVAGAGGLVLARRRRERPAGDEGREPLAADEPGDRPSGDEPRDPPR